MSAKIHSKTRYVLLGTSRSLRIDPLLPQKYLHSKITHLGFHGQSISQWNLILKKMQNRQINTILGLDSFAINQYYDEHLNLGVTLFENTINKNNGAFYFLHRIFIEKIIFFPIEKLTKRDTILQKYDAEESESYSFDDIVFL